MRLIWRRWLDMFRIRIAVSLNSVIGCPCSKISTPRTYESGPCAIKRKNKKKPFILLFRKREAPCLVMRLGGILCSHPVLQSTSSLHGFDSNFRYHFGAPVQPPNNVLALRRCEGTLITPPAVFCYLSRTSLGSPSWFRCASAENSLGPCSEIRPRLLCVLPKNQVLEKYLRVHVQSGEGLVPGLEGARGFSGTYSAPGSSTRLFSVPRGSGCAGSIAVRYTKRKAY